MSDDEQKVRNAVMNVICNAMNFPKPASVYILGQDMGPLGGKIVAAVLPLIAATRTAALKEAADHWSAWETFTASDGNISIRQHGQTVSEWLRARAAKEDSE